MQAIGTIPKSMTKFTVIARWESRGRKYWVELTEELIKGCEPSYSYKSDNGGGFIGSGSKDVAIAHCERQASYCPSKMRRVL